MSSSAWIVLPPALHAVDLYEGSLAVSKRLHRAFFLLHSSFALIIHARALDARPESFPTVSSNIASDQPNI